MKKQRLIEIHSQGMNVTQLGENTLKVFRDAEMIFSISKMKLKTSYE